MGRCGPVIEHCAVNATVSCTNRFSHRVVKRGELKTGGVVKSVDVIPGVPTADSFVLCVTIGNSVQVRQQGMHHPRLRVITRCTIASGCVARRADGGGFIAVWVFCSLQFGSLHTTTLALTGAPSPLPCRTDAQSQAGAT